MSTFRPDWLRVGPRLVQTMVSAAEPPWRRPRFPLELLEPAEMAEADRLAAQTTASTSLMQRAGEAVARAALRLVGKSGTRHVVILCGPGNNGGDGYVAAQVLDEAGCRVTVATLGPRDALKGDAAWAAARWSGAAVALADAPIETATLIVDALFGAGLGRDIDSDSKEVIERANVWAGTTGGPILAVDIPSGIDGASGAVRGTAIRASDTVTFFRLKPGHILVPGRLHCGAIALADIGIESSVLDRVKPTTTLNATPLWATTFPLPKIEGHKYSRGHAVVVSGPIAQTGAARLCARGALRAGAGLVTVATPSDALAVHAASLTAVMTRVADGPDGLANVLADPRMNAVVLGPGLGVGEITKKLVFEALRPVKGAPRGIVLDADVLSSFAAEPRALFDAIRASGHAAVLTPHDGEFATLFGNALDVADAKPRRARTAAAISGAVVVLKGPDTVVAHPDGRATIAGSEAPWLATAGSGDVLAGMIAGLMAQLMPPFEASAAAVWLHAEAARTFGPGLVSEDIPEALPSVLRDLLASDAITVR